MRERAGPAHGCTGAWAHAMLFAPAELDDVAEPVEDFPPDLDGQEISVVFPVPERGGADTEPFHHLLLGQENIVVLFLGSLCGIFDKNALREFAGQSQYAFSRKGQGDVFLSSRNGGHELFREQPAVIVGVEVAILDGRTLR